MAWGLSSWLVLVRCIQLLGAFACAAMNGFLIAYIYSNKLGLSDTMVSLEWLICVLLLYTALVLLVLHTGTRSSKTPWLVFSIVMDVIFIGVDLAVITLLARAGVPSNCTGLTSAKYADGDAPNDPDHGYSTIRFGDSGDQKGELDKWCALERAYYFVAVAIMISYTTTIVLSILRICEDKYTRKDRFYRALDVVHEGQNSYVLDKLDDGQPLSKAHSPRIPPPAPPSEGITSPRASIRTPTRAPQSPHHVTQAVPDIETASRRDSVPPRKPVPQRIPSIISYAPSSSSRSPPQLVPGIVSDDSEEQAAAAAMITDGPRFEGGYQPGIPALPPYSPSSPVRMSGYAGEDNEMGMSGYVGGQTRTQDVKDSRRF